MLIRYTAYLKASSALLSFWSSVNIAPVIIQPPREIQSVVRKSQKISENLKKNISIKHSKIQAGRNEGGLTPTLVAYCSNSGLEIGKPFID